MSEAQKNYASDIEGHPDAPANRWQPDRPPVSGEPRTEAGKALVEWAGNAYPGQDQVRIWREHVLLIEDQARALPPLQPFAVTCGEDR